MSVYLVLPQNNFGDPLYFNEKGLEGYLKGTGVELDLVNCEDVYEAYSCCEEMDIPVVIPLAIDVITELAKTETKEGLQ